MKLLVFGAGGHAKVVADILAKQGKYPLAAFVDEKRKGQIFLGLPCYSEQDLKGQSFTHAIVAIGDNWTRAQVVARLKAIYPEIEFVTAVHPSAVIGADVSLGSGSVVMAGAVVNPGTRVSDHVILNTSSSVDHDCELGEFSSIAPGAVLGGNCKVGSFAAVSLGATVIHGRTIGTHTVIGAGSVVLTDIESECVAWGSPCIKQRSRKPDDRYL